MSSPAEHPLLRSLDDALRFLRWLALVVFAVVLGSGVRVVGPDEVALVLRFGRLVGETRADQVRGPGLLVALPYLIDRVVRVPVKRVQKVPVEVLIGQQNSDWVDLTKDGYLMTGDRNVIQVQAVVRYRIADPVAYTLRVAQPRRMVRDVTIAALTHSCARMRVDALLGEGKRELARRTLAYAGQWLKDIGAGVQLVALDLAQVRPPPQAAREFQDVHNAFIEQKTAIQKAQSSAQQRVLMAEARADKAVRDAHAHGAWLVARARGEAPAFARLAQQASAGRGGALLRERLYREAMEHVFAKAGARLVVPEGHHPARIRLPVSSGNQHDKPLPHASPTPWQRQPTRGER